MTSCWLESYKRNLNWKMKETEEIEEDRLMKDRELNSKDKDNTVGR